jgi:hypothetical protein
MICSVMLLLCVSTVNLQAQATGRHREDLCFAIHVRLNGNVVDGPETVTFKTKEHEWRALLEEGCFKVPSAVLTEKNIDLFFTVPGNKVYVSTIPIGFLAGPWDIDLADKRFSREVVLPKHVRARDACAVVFHVGEPETAYAMAPCRTRF